jgi:hypothetical protein
MGVVVESEMRWDLYLYYDLTCFIFIYFSFTNIYDIKNKVCELEVNREQPAKYTFGEGQLPALGEDGQPLGGDDATSPTSPTTRPARKSVLSMFTGWSEVNCWNWKKKEEKEKAQVNEKLIRSDSGVVRMILELFGDLKESIAVQYFVLILNEDLSRKNIHLKKNLLAWKQDSVEHSSYLLSHLFLFHLLCIILITVKLMR